ncbi:hypothetical protein DTO006G1_823 [Penicillium roqueforti]|nr:hypothetical protein CBS147337_754 [Penicillium roqueforti]KAI2686448.1 hypothetical protein CBS147355_1935 [Penicillium roqueforti]KAI2691503.1 hypothetical protein LCP963914a_1704 [Penicillium roqueforti]KAI2764405.1 hypothetical protein DTO006G1_823 [Penicillium roqueforti]KAI3172308.1 hypothetical protein CBS147317_1737 [Penicillium roqueforti]
MAPRRGSGSYSSYVDDNPWSDTTWLSLEHYYPDEYKPLFITQFVFDIISLLAFVAFLIWACRIRNRSLPLKALICALISSICCQINIIAWEALYVAEAQVTMYYLISLMLWDLFKVVAICLTFYVFWNLIHRLLGFIRVSGKPHAAVTTIHYLLLGIIFVASLAEWGMCVASYVRSVVSTLNADMQWSWTQLNVAVYIIYWLLSLEILAWGIFLAIKARSYAFWSKSPLPSPGALTIVQFVLWVGTYTGLLLCCAKWHNLDQGPKYPAPDYQSQFPEGHYPQIQQPYDIPPYVDHSTQHQAHPHHVST